MDKYKNSKIYDITSNNTDRVYVGSCITTLKRRLTLHKSKNNCASKYILECGDYNINLIENYSCNNKDELRIREQYWIDKYRKDGKNIINVRNAYLSKEQRQEQPKIYYANNREKLIEYKKEYNIKNRDKNKEYCREYYKKNHKKQKEYHKKNRNKNREKKIEYNREYNLFKKPNVVNGCYEFLEMLKEY